MLLTRRSQRIRSFWADCFFWSTSLGMSRPLVFMGTCNACKGRRSSPSPSLFLFPFFSWQDSPAGKTRQNPPRWGDFFRRGLFASTNYRVPVPLVMVRTQTAFGVRTNLHIDFFARSKSKLQKVSPCPLIILCMSFCSRSLILTLLRAPRGPIAKKSKASKTRFPFARSQRLLQ